MKNKAWKCVWYGSFKVAVKQLKEVNTAYLQFMVYMFLIITNRSLWCLFWGWFKKWPDERHGNRLFFLRSPAACVTRSRGNINIIISHRVSLGYGSSGDRWCETRSSGSGRRLPRWPTYSAWIRGKQLEAHQLVASPRKPLLGQTPFSPSVTQSSLRSSLCASAQIHPHTRPLSSARTHTRSGANLCANSPSALLYFSAGDAQGRNCWIRLFGSQKVEQKLLAHFMISFFSFEWQLFVAIFVSFWLFYLAIFLGNRGVGFKSAFGGQNEQFCEITSLDYNIWRYVKIKPHSALQSSVWSGMCLCSA